MSGSQSAASLELATGGDPVMAIGGFNGEGGHLSLAQFKRYVAAGDIHYYIASTGAAQAGWRGRGLGASAPRARAGGAPTGAGASAAAAPPARPSAATRAPAAPAGAGRPGAGRRVRRGPGGYSASSITSWVKAHYKSVTIGGQTVYDLRRRSDPAHETPDRISVWPLMHCYSATVLARPKNGAVKTKPKE